MPHPAVLKAYKENDFPYVSRANEVNEAAFFEQAKLAKAHVRREITQIVRIKQGNHEWFTFNEHLTATNKLGNKIDHSRVVGKYEIPNFTYQLNENGQRTTTQIESKDTVYELRWKEDFTPAIEKDVSDKVSLVVIADRHWSGFTYQQFKEHSFEDLVTIAKFGSLDPKTIRKEETRQTKAKNNRR